MSGHSKWATTKHKKAVIDARRAKAFAKYIKVIEVAELIDAWCGRGKAYPDFAEAFAVQQTVDAVKESSRRHSWVEVASI